MIKNFEENKIKAQEELNQKEIQLQDALYEVEVIK